MQPFCFIFWLGVAAAFVLPDRVKSYDDVGSASSARSAAVVECKTFVIGGAIFAIDLPKAALFHGLVAGEGVTLI
jgi:hypothetical protein